MVANPHSGLPAEQIDMRAVRRRIADRRDQLGLSEAALANQAGMSPLYLRHLTEAGPPFDAGGLIRIAAVLRMTYRELLDGPADAPPGQSEAPAHPALVHLTETECWEKVGARGVGRIAVPAEPSPVVVPVNYTVDARTFVYRTAPHGVAAVPHGSPLSFQVDRIDDRTREGWSVLVTGTAEHLTDPDTIRRLEDRSGAEPWAGGSRPLWIRIRPEGITGRRIGTIAPDGHVH